MIEFVLAANVGLFAVLVVLLAQRGYLNAFSGLSMYLAFHFVTFVERPIVVYLFDIRSEFIFMNYMPTEDVLLETIFVANVGLVSFALGYLRSLRFSPISVNFQVPSIGPEERRSFALAFLILSPFIAYSFYLVFTMRQGLVGAIDEVGQIDMVTDPATGVTLFQDTTAYIVFARNLALPLAAFLILNYKARWWSALPLLLCVLISLQTGGRWQFVISAIVAATMVLYLNRRQVPRLREVLLMMLVLILFVALGESRDVVAKFLTTGEIDLDFDLANSSFAAHPDFANYEFLTYVLAKVPEVSRTWSYFTQYLGLFTQPIPRMFWPDKPVVSPVLLVDLQQYGQFASRTTSLVGDGWISLGYLGVVITLGLVGAFYGWAYRRFCQSGISIYYFCAYFWILALLIQWARDGGYRISDFFFFCLSPILLAYCIRRWMPTLGPNRRSAGGLGAPRLPMRYD